MSFLHSPVLFRDQEGQSLHLVVKPCRERNAVVELIKLGGGEVLEEATEYAVTFQSPSCEAKGPEEVYSLAYIKDCCVQNKLLYLRPYRLNKESRYPDDFEATDVFLKYVTWKDALEGKPFTRNVLPFDLSSSNYSSSSESPSSPPVQISPEVRRKKRNMLKKSLVLESSDTEFDDVGLLEELQIKDKLKLDEARASSSQDNVSRTRSQVATVFANKKADLKRRTKYDNSSGSSVSDSFIVDPQSFTTKKKAKIARREYSERERRNIIEYIIENKAYDNVKGREIWQKMEAKKICPGRTWQSLKEHYIKKIMPRLDTFDIPEEQIRKLQGQEEDSSSSSEISRTEAVSHTGLKRREYTKSEKLKIIQHIIDSRAYDYVKGREFWQKMEAEKICPGRTWQSLKEHYMKQIVPKINDFKIPEEEKRKLKRMRYYK